MSCENDRIELYNKGILRITRKKTGSNHKSINEYITIEGHIKFVVVIRGYTYIYNYDTGKDIACSDIASGIFMSYQDVMYVYSYTHGAVYIIIRFENSYRRYVESVSENAEDYLRLFIVKHLRENNTKYDPRLVGYLKKDKVIGPVKAIKHILSFSDIILLCDQVFFRLSEAALNNN